MNGSMEGFESRRPPSKPRNADPIRGGNKESEFLVQNWSDLSTVAAHPNLGHNLCASCNCRLVDPVLACL